MWGLVPGCVEEETQAEENQIWVEIKAFARTSSTSLGDSPLNPFLHSKVAIRKIYRVVASIKGDNVHKNLFQIRLRNAVRDCWFLCG